MVVRRSSSATSKSKRRPARRAKPRLKFATAVTVQDVIDSTPPVEADEAGSDWPFVPTYNARSLIARAVFKDSLTAKIRSDLRLRKPVTILITTPTADWTLAIAAQASAFYPFGKVVSAAKAPAKSATLECPDPIKPVIAISPNLSWLAPTVIAGADHKLRLKIRPSVIARALAEYCGKGRIRVQNADVSGLDLPDITYAMRPGSTPRECVERMRRAVESRSAMPSTKIVPKLDELAGYGPAAQTMKRLAIDFERKREAALPFTMPGVLLHGRPGGGKTMLAQSFARSVNAPFLSTSVAQWFRAGDGHLGDVAIAAQRFFDRAVAQAPSVALLDEIDAIPDRAAMDGRERSWWTPIVTGLLMQIDDLRRSESGVVLIAATNHFDQLDSALIRPGRFDLHVEIKGPETPAEVEGVFRHCLEGDLRGDDIAPVIRLAGLATGAEIESWVRLARDQASRETRPLSLTDLVDVIVPPEVRPQNELEEIAFHEAAHAAVGYWLGVDVKYASLLASGKQAGSTQIGPEGGIFSRIELELRATAMLAGRASDEILSRGPTSGAASDLHKATALVLDIHARLGLGDTLLARESAEFSHLLLDPILRALVEDDLRRLMENARAHVRRLEVPIRTLAAQLVQNRVITADDIAAVVGPRGSARTQLQLELAR